MRQKSCPMCSYRMVTMDEETPFTAHLFDGILDGLYEKHIDDHVEDFRIEMLMTLDA